MFLVVRPPDTLFLPPSIVPKWRGLRGLAEQDAGALLKRPVDQAPQPSDHVLAQLKAGETVYQAGELPKTLRASKIPYEPPKTVCETPFASIFPPSMENGDGTRRERPLARAHARELRRGPALAEFVDAQDSETMWALDMHARKVREEPGLRIMLRFEENHGLNAQLIPATLELF